MHSLIKYLLWTYYVQEWELAQEKKHLKTLYHDTWGAYIPLGGKDPYFLSTIEIPFRNTWYRLRVT